MTAKRRNDRADGYQEALEDIVAAVQRDGMVGVFEWVRDNTANPKTRGIALVVIDQAREAVEEADSLLTRILLEG